MYRESPEAHNNYGMMCIILSWEQEMLGIQSMQLQCHVAYLLVIGIVSQKFIYDCTIQLVLTLSLYIHIYISQ